MLVNVTFDVGRHGGHSWAGFNEERIEVRAEEIPLGRSRAERLEEAVLRGVAEFALYSVATGASDGRAWPTRKPPCRRRDRAPFILLGIQDADDEVHGAARGEVLAAIARARFVPTIS